MCRITRPLKGKKYVVTLKGIEPGVHGAATADIDGMSVPYTMSWRRRKDGTNEMVVLSDGWLYDSTNSTVEL